MNTVDELKARFKKSTSEELFDISNPPDYQCSNIDEVLKSLKSATKEIKNYNRMEADELISAVEWVDHYISGLDFDIEKIRTEIEHVRAWGQEWKDLFKYHVDNGNINIENLSLKEEVA